MKIFNTHAIYIYGQIHINDLSLIAFPDGKVITACCLKKYKQNVCISNESLKLSGICF